jgi:hypothetical protein
VTASKKTGLWLAVFAVGLGTAGVCLGANGRKADFASTLRTGDTIAIDGVNQEWSGKLVPIKDTQVSMAFYNDDQFLYLCLTTSDRATRSQIQRQGLSLWFDADGGKKKAFGLEFPLGMRGMTVVERRGDTGEPGLAQRPLDADQERIGILTSGKSTERESLRLEEAGRIQAKIGDDNGVLVYEMKVPLRKSDAAPYAIGAKPGGIIGIGLQTPEFQWRDGGSGTGGGEGRPGGGGGGSWGGMGGRGGMGGGGMGGGRGRGGEAGMRGRGEMPKPLKHWTTVELAAPAR